MDTDNNNTFQLPLQQQIKTEEQQAPVPPPLPPPPPPTQAKLEPDYSVDVSIEPNHECEIVEMKFDGQEIYKEPLTHSEYLAELIGKIDFYAESENAQKDDQPNKNELNNARKIFQMLHERVKTAWDEISVLLDCLTIARADKLMLLDMEKKHASVNEEKLIDVTDKTLSLVLKKKNIEKSKILLKKSLDKINNDHEYHSNRFHLELYRARQLWRIKKIGKKFNVDLSYRTVGCGSNHLKASYELIKNDSANKDVSNKTQYLSVIIPDEMHDYAFIRVEIVNSMKNTESKSVFDSKFSLFTNFNPVNNTNPTWQEVLERAQNALYCKEIYHQLLREVFDPNNSQELRPIITGNSIKMMITVDYDLIISLIHNVDKNPPTAQQTNQLESNYDNSLLEYFLHDLLKKSFEQNFYHYDQRPITSTFGFNSHVKIAGISYVNLNSEEDNALITLPNNVNHLLNKKKKINLLQSIRDKAEHLIVRKKVIKIINQLCKEVSEPHFLIEPSLWNNATNTDIRITITSYYYDTMAKSSYYILIKENQVNVLNRSNNMSIPFGECIDDLRYYFLDQCCLHQINLIVTLSQILGWTVVGSSFTNLKNTLIMSGTALLYNDIYKKKIAIKLTSVNQIELNVFQTDEKESKELDSYSFENSSCDEWVYIKENFLPVDINSYPGFTLIQKYELFLANFSTTKFIPIN